MTVTEAITGAAERHEFRRFEYVTKGPVILVQFVCYAGCKSAEYLTRESARNAHTRHQNERRRRAVPR